MTPDATCRCPNQPDHPCGNLVTQEDLLCDACRDVRNGTGQCAAVSGPCCGTFHFTLVLLEEIPRAFVLTLEGT